THKWSSLPSVSTIGKLRLQRVGSKLRFLVSEGDMREFTQLDEVEFGTAEVRYVQFGGNTGGALCGLDIRLLDVTVQAEGMPGLDREGRGVGNGVSNGGATAAGREQGVAGRGSRRWIAARRVGRCGLVVLHASPWFRGGDCRRSSGGAE